MTLTITSHWEHSMYGRNDATNHLLVTITATGDQPQRPPLDLAFALDRSGSMQGQNKLELVKQAVLAAAAQLQDTDRVALVVFDDRIETIHNLTPMDSEHRRHLERVLTRVIPGRSTDLSGGWLEACRQIADSAARSGRVARALLLTDGQANLGIIASPELAKHAEKLRERGISTSAIGVGEDFDEILLSSMTEAGGGNFEYIATAAGLEAFFMEELKSLTSIVATQPYLDIAIPETRIQLVNRFPQQAQPGRVSVDLRDLSVGESLNLVFEVTSRHVRAESLTPALHLHWSHPLDGKISEINEDGATIPVGDASAAVRDDSVAAIVAVEIAARAQREAVELDRAGHFKDRHDLMGRMRMMLSAAPQTDAVTRMAEDTDHYFAYTSKAPMDEHARKRAVHDSHRFSRGRAQQDATGETRGDRCEQRRGPGGGRHQRGPVDAGDPFDEGRSWKDLSGGGRLHRHHHRGPCGRPGRRG